MKIFDFDFDKLKIDQNMIAERDLEDEGRRLYEILKSANIGLDIYNKIMPLIDRIEYGTGGKCVRRGYYCPDLYSTFAVGGCNRGKLLRKVSKNSNVTYEFCYSGSEIVMVKTFGGKPDNLLYNVEIVERKGDIEVGVDFNIDHYDNTINENVSVYICQYENSKLICDRILSDIQVRSNGDLIEFDYSKNWYTYKEGVLDGATHTDYFYSIGIVNEDNITFLHDEKGCPIKFIVDSDMEYMSNISKANIDYYRKEHMKINISDL